LAQTNLISIEVLDLDAEVLQREVLWLRVNHLIRRSGQRAKQRLERLHFSTPNATHLYGKTHGPQEQGNAKSPRTTRMIVKVDLRRGL
jgi:hypothetical protein